jgi:hypothetical protein
VLLRESLARKLRVEAAREGVDGRDIVTQALEAWFKTRKTTKPGLPHTFRTAARSNTPNRSRRISRRVQLSSTIEPKTRFHFDEVEGIKL